MKKNARKSQSPGRNPVKQVNQLVELIKEEDTNLMEHGQELKEKWKQLQEILYPYVAEGQEIPKPTCSKKRLKKTNVPCSEIFQLLMELRALCWDESNFLEKFRAEMWKKFK